MVDLSKVQGKEMTTIEKAGGVAIVAIVAAIYALVSSGLRRSRGTANGSAASYLSETKGFQPIPADLVVRLRIVPQSQQRYETEGDWEWEGDALEIRVSREAGDEDPRYTTLLFVHELIEAILCREAGVTGAQVDAFDMSYRKSGEPGDDPAAPYHPQHIAAEAAERALATQLGVNWNEYLGK